MSQPKSHMMEFLLLLAESMCMIAIRALTGIQLKLKDKIGI